MIRSNNFRFKLSDVIDYFGSDSKIDFELHCFSILKNPKSNSVFYVKALDEKQYENICQVENAIIFLKEGILNPAQIEALSSNNFLVVTQSPRLDLFKFACHLSDNIITAKKLDYNFVNGSAVCTEAKIDETVLIEPGAYVGSNVTIGKNTIIKSGARINDNVSIGNNCFIGCNTVVGGHGFGGEKDTDGFIYMMPHVGGVIIKDYVMTGALVTIVSGTIEPTIIGEHSKIDDHVHVAHNSVVGKSCFITACAQLGGSDVLGNDVWIGPNASMMQNITVGNNVTIGLGAVITKNVPEGQTMVGNPADTVENFVRQRRDVKKLLDENKSK